MSTSKPPSTSSISTQHGGEPTKDDNKKNDIKTTKKNPYQFIEFKPSSTASLGLGPLHFESNIEDFKTSPGVSTSSQQQEHKRSASDASSIEAQSLWTDTEYAGKTQIGDREEFPIQQDVSRLHLNSAHKKFCEGKGNQNELEYMMERGYQSQRIYTPDSGSLLRDKTMGQMSLNFEFNERQGGTTEFGFMSERGHQGYEARSRINLPRDHSIERAPLDYNFNERQQSNNELASRSGRGFEIQSSPRGILRDDSGRTSNYEMRRNVGDYAEEDGRLHERQVSMLRTQGFTTGLAKALLENAKVFDHRIWLVDNSGSMQLCDGTRIVTSSSPPRVARKGGQHARQPNSPQPRGGGGGSTDVVTSVQCTRWEELQDTVQYHAQMAALMQSPTIFRLLNEAIGVSQVESNQFSVAEGMDAIEYEQEVQNVFRVMQSIQPGGVTPITEHLIGIQRSILERTPDLRRHNKKVAVVLATDGLPTDEQGYDGPYVTKKFISALRQLEKLPVWLVVRLCTNERPVRDFYNNLDERLELSLDVLDDYEEEANEVFRHNKWLNYALPLHRCRELGYHDRLFDLIDERTLSATQMRSFCALLFGVENIDDIPEPAVDSKGFLNKVESLLDDEWEQWHPIKKKMAPWIDMKALDKTYCKKQGMFSSFRKT